MRWPTSPPVHDSTVPSVTPRLADRPPTRPASAVRSASGSSATLSSLRSGRRRRRREQPGLGHPGLAERPERGAIEREGRRPRGGCPHLDRVTCREPERPALAEDLASSPSPRIDLAVHPDLDP